jgi:hypothetical protein
MRNRDEIKQLFEYFENEEDKPLNFDEETIVSAYQKNNDNQSMSIKVLSVFGGILASLAFMGFLFIAGIYNSGTSILVFGIIFIAISIWLNKAYDRIIIDTVSVSSFIIGLILLGFGCTQLNINSTIISIILIVVALVSLSIVQRYIFSFVSVLIINGSIMMLIISNNHYNLIPIYVSALALGMTYIFLKEAKIITTHKAFSKLYNPIRIGLTFSFLAGLVFLGKRGILPVSYNYIWPTTIIIVSAIIYLLSDLFDILNITKIQHKVGIYILCVLLLLPTALSPAISGSILIIMLSFMVNYKTGFALGVISFIYFISQYYYDLNFTLLAKSILLFSSGILFIGLYFLTSKKLTTNEKV